MNNLTKFLLWVVGPIAIVALALWIFGGKKVRYETSLEINAPASVVFPYLINADLQKKWMDGLVDMAIPNGSHSEIGSMAQTTIRRGERQFRFEDTVLRFEKDNLLSIRSENGAFSNTSFFELDERDGKTHLRYLLKKSRLGVARFSALFSPENAQEQIESDIRNLKKLIEKDYNDS